MLLSYRGLGEDMKTRTLITALAAGILASAGMAHADTVTATLPGNYDVTDPSAGVYPGTSDMSVAFATSVTGSPTPYLVNTPAFVGQINWTNASESGPLLSSLGTSFSTFCIEGTQDVYFGGGPYQWNVQTDITQAPVNSSYNLPQFDANQVSELNKFYDANLASVTDAATATAFQLGVWEIAGDGAGGLTAGSDYFGTGFFLASGSSAVDATALADATSWLDAVANGTAKVQTNYTLYALTANGIQDQLVAIPNFGATQTSSSTPIPAALPAGLSP